MANPLKGEAAFQAGSETMTLVFDINALCNAEDASGMKTAELLTELDGGESMKVLRAIIWAGLQAKHPCNLLRAGEIIQAAGPGVAAKAMRDGLAAAFPPAGDKGDDRPQTATDGTGSAG